MSATERDQNMNTNLPDLQPDASKADRGQKAAGTRIRNAMQTLKADAQSLRVKILEARKS